METDIPPVSQVLRMVCTVRQAIANPFNITKAVDFSDEEIKATWVDLPGGDSFFRLANPRSPMPMLLLGGKGSGRTHLMRYFSYSLQKLRHPVDDFRGIVEEGYIGIYLRCGGLNAARFAGKGQDDEVWDSVFSYYMDLWLAQLTLEIVSDLQELQGVRPGVEAQLCRGVLGLFDDPLGTAGTLGELRSLIHEEQQRLDFAINNVALTRRLEVTIRATRGRLVFGIPQMVLAELPLLRSTQFLYLVDEFENLGADQQKYINTLVREKEPPCSFKIGARLYGVRTNRTYSAGEENREGSEYETVRLDHMYLQEHRYRTFARQVVARRLVESDLAGVSAHDPEGLAAHLEVFFDELQRDDFMREESQHITDKPSVDRPYFRRLYAQLIRAGASGHEGLLMTRRDVIRIVGLLTVSQYPLLEKLNIFLLYQDWYDRKDLRESAAGIADECHRYMHDQKAETRHRHAMGHFQYDLFAQLLRDTDQKQRYLGIDTFVAMSAGLPRNLLVILKHIFRWADFNRENPFSTELITRESQRLGVLEASNWFYEDARVLGEHGQEVQDGIRRLNDMLRAMRYSDKPVESSLITFSVDLSLISPEAHRTIEAAEQWSLLLRLDSGQRDRNTGRITDKFQVNTMLCPRWDLPTSRRGVLALTPGEGTAIFDKSASIRYYDPVVRSRLERMMAPFNRSQHDQSQLPGLDV